MKNILIVEDEEELAANISEILASLDYKVVGIADNALDALKTLEKAPVDLVLMDIMIKGDIDGIDLAVGGDPGATNDVSRFD